MGEADDLAAYRFERPRWLRSRSGRRGLCRAGGGRLDARTIRVARSDGEGSDLLYAVNDGTGWTIEAVDPPGRGLIAVFAGRCPTGCEEGVLVAMPRLFCSRHGEAVDMVSGGIYFG